MIKDTPKKLNNLLKIISLLTVIIYLYYRNYGKVILALMTFILTFYDYLALKLFKIKFNNSNKISITLFIFLSQYLGSCLDFYEKFSWWDIKLHFTSGILIFYVGLDIYNQIYKSKRVIPKLLFATLFALSLANIWEIMEFIFDGTLHMDTQRAGNLVGRFALEDTMTDLIVSTLGTFLASIVNYFKLRKQV